MTTLQDLLNQVETVLDLVEFDDMGQVVGQARVGGNGGLLTVETIRQASLLRRDVMAFRRQLADTPAAMDTAGLYRARAEALRRGGDKSLADTIVRAYVGAEA